MNVLEDFSSAAASLHSLDAAAAGTDAAVSFVCQQSVMAEADGTPPAFLALAERMADGVRALLVDNVTPSTVAIERLLAELGVDAKRHLLAENAAHVLSQPGALMPAACAVLRNAVDERRSTQVDSVDGAAEHQLPLTLAQLEALVGGEAARALCALPATFHARAPSAVTAGASATAAPHLGAPDEIFVRRYSGGTRPWNPFHQDAAALTINVALADDSRHGGGRLIAAMHDAVRVLPRTEGEATVHDARLLHAVSRITSGARYSLILFFGRAEVREAPSEVAAFDRLLTTLGADEAARLRARLQHAEAPLVAALRDAEAAMAEAFSHAAPAKAAIDAARADVASAEAARAQMEHADAAPEAWERAAHVARRARDRLEQAVASAQAKRNAHFRLQVRVQQLRHELVGVRQEVRARLVREQEQDAAR